MPDKTVSVNVGGVFPALLTTLFIGLKLTNYITWPWVWVLAPIWLPVAVLLAAVALAAVIYIILEIIKKA